MVFGADFDLQAGSTVTGNGCMRAASGTVQVAAGFDTGLNASLTTSGTATVRVLPAANVSNVDLFVTGGTLRFVNSTAGASYSWRRGSTTGGAVQIDAGVDVSVENNVSVWEPSVWTVDGRVTSVVRTGVLHLDSGLVQGGGVINITGEMFWGSVRVFNVPEIGKIFIQPRALHVVDGNRNPLLGGWTYQNLGKLDWRNGTITCDDCLFNTTLDGKNFTFIGPVDGVFQYNDSVALDYFANFLECEFEWYGERCQCNIWSNLTITDLPSFMLYGQSGIVADNLTLVVIESLKYQNTTFNFTNDECQKHWTWTSEMLTKNDECERRWVGTAPWNKVWSPGAADACGFFRREDDSNIYFDVDFRAESKEKLPLVRGEHPIRELVFRLPFTVAFPKFVAITQPARVQAFAQVLLVSAVSEQLVQFQPASSLISGSVQLTTSLQWPFELTAPSWLSTRADINRVLLQADAGDAGPCDQQTAGSVCIQRWRFVVRPGAGLCDLTGVYELGFTVRCRTGRAADCPILPDTDESRASLQVSLATGDLCPRVVDTINVTMALSTYEDAALQLAKDEFIDPQRLYARLDVVSARASLVETRLRSLTVLKSETFGAIAMMNNFALQPAGTQMALTAAPGGATVPGGTSSPTFSFNVLGSALQIAPDSSEFVQLNALVAVQYRSVAPAAASGAALQSERFELRGLRAEMQSAQRNRGQDLLVGVRVNVTVPAEPESKVLGVVPKAQALAVAVAIGVVVLLLVATAVALWRRRRSQEGVEEPKVAHASSSAELMPVARSASAAGESLPGEPGEPADLAAAATAIAEEDENATQNELAATQPGAPAAAVEHEEEEEEEKTTSDGRDSRPPTMAQLPMLDVREEDGSTNDAPQCPSPESEMEDGRTSQQTAAKSE